MFLDVLLFELETSENILGLIKKKIKGCEMETFDKILNLKLVL